jgi:cytochrome c556
LSAAGADADDAEAVRALYAQLRQRFSDWREEYERLHEQNETGAFGLPDEFAERYAELDRRLTKLLDDVGQLEARARKVRRETDDPLDKNRGSGLAFRLRLGQAYRPDRMQDLTPTGSTCRR